MLAIRMQRTGRKGHAMFRVVVQDTRVTPTSGKVVALLGSYDPHAKNLTLDKEKASFYLGHGAQPSDRAARLLQGEGVELPNWVKQRTAKKGTLRNPDKLRKNQPKDEAKEVAEAPTEVAATEEAPADETKTEA
jgi:small subunit ribosomal protein S16